MRTTILFLFLALFGTASAQVQVTIPPIGRALGLGPKTEVYLVNDTPLFGTVVSMNENLGDFDPGATLVSTTSCALEYSPALVAVLYYETPARDRVVGIAVGEVWVRRGEVQSKVFHLQDIRFLNGNSAGYRDVYPTQVKGNDREIELPSMGLMCTTWVLWANATLFDVEVYINGRQREIIPAGGLYWEEIKNIAEVNRPVIVKMACLDGGRPRGSVREGDFTPGYNYPTTRVFFMDAYWFPRY